MTDDFSDETREGRCPRCAAAAGFVRAWNELDEAEREVVRRLPASAVYSLAERSARHLWCVRCWHEETGSAQHDA